MAIVEPKMVDVLTSLATDPLSTDGTVRKKLKDTLRTFQDEYGYGFAMEVAGLSKIMFVAIYFYPISAC